MLQTLSGEIAFFDGKVRLHGSFCYVPQEPCNYILTFNLDDSSMMMTFDFHRDLLIYSEEEYSSLEKNTMVSRFRRVIRAAALESVCVYTFITFE